MSTMFAFLSPRLYFKSRAAMAYNGSANGCCAAGMIALASPSFRYRTLWRLLQPTGECKLIPAAWYPLRVSGSRSGKAMLILRNTTTTVTNRRATNRRAWHIFDVRSCIRRLLFLLPGVLLPSFSKYLTLEKQLLYLVFRLPVLARRCITVGTSRTFT